MHAWKIHLFCTILTAITIIIRLTTGASNVSKPFNLMPSLKVIEAIISQVHISKFSDSPDLDWPTRFWCHPTQGLASKEYVLYFGELREMRVVVSTNYSRFILNYFSISRLKSYCSIFFFINSVKLKFFLFKFLKNFRTEN